MKLKYDQPKGARVKYGFFGYTTLEQGWCYNLSLKRWEYNPEFGKYHYSTHAPAKSVKAFRRSLKSAPKGVKFILVSRWKGYDVHGVGNGSSDFLIAKES